MWMETNIRPSEFPATIIELQLPDGTALRMREATAREVQAELNRLFPPQQIASCGSFSVDTEGAWIVRSAK